MAEHKEPRAGFWQARIAEWERSNQTQAAFCEVRGLNLGTFRSWLYKPDRKQARAEAVDQVDGMEAPAAKASAGFVRLVVKSASTDENASSVHWGLDDRSAIEVRLGNGRRVAVGPGFDATTLQRVVRVLEESTC